MPFVVAGAAKEKWLFRKYERDCSRGNKRDSFTNVNNRVAV